MQAIATTMRVNTHIAALVPMVAFVVLVVCAGACGAPPATPTSVNDEVVVAVDEPQAESATNFDLPEPRYTAVASSYVEEHGTAAVAVRADDPSWGEPLAPVTIVMFSDLQCPYCAKVMSTMTALREKYGAHKLRIVWKDFPLTFHKQALPASMAARAVYELGGDTAFWDFLADVFSNQRDLDAQHFEMWARSTGVSEREFRRLSNDPRVRDRVEANIDDGKTYGVTGTPAFFVNGRHVSGARDVAAFSTEIDEELDAGAELVARGTPREHVYVDRTNANFVSPPPAGGRHVAGPPAPAADTTTVWKIPVHKDDPVRGGKNAQVTIVELGEFQCPFCKKVEPVLTKLLADYGSQLRLVWKDNPLPFHTRATPAAMVAREVFRQKSHAGFWTMHAALFANQDHLEDADLFGYATGAGAQLGLVKHALTTNRHQKILDRSQMEATDFEASGTPAFFINGRRLKGAQPEASFKAIIDEEIIRANALLAAGIHPAKLYDELIKNGKGPAPLEKKSVPAPPADAPFRGGKNAKVVVQAFSDFQCPFCSRATSVIDTVVKTYGQRVKVVWRHKPLSFHKDAQLAHEASVEAYVQKGNDGFWKMHDKLFANQRAMSRQDLETFASEIGLDMNKFIAALDSRRHQARVDADGAVSTTAGISGTPGFVINGYFISGAQPFTKFKRVIDKALSASP